MQWHAPHLSVYEVAPDGARDPGDAAGAAGGDGVPCECTEIATKVQVGLWGGRVCFRPFLLVLLLLLNEVSFIRLFATGNCTGVDDEARAD